MGERVRVSDRRLPGVTVARVVARSGEVIRNNVYKDDRVLGTVVYVTRQVKGGTTWGWRTTEEPKNVRLTDRVDAIERLIEAVATKEGLRPSPEGGDDAR